MAYGPLGGPWAYWMAYGLLAGLAIMLSMCQGFEDSPDCFSFLSIRKRPGLEKVILGSNLVVLPVVLPMVSYISGGPLGHSRFESLFFSLKN